MFSNFHEIVTIEEGKPKETTFKTSKCKRALESTYKFRTDSGRKLLSAIKNNFYSVHISFYAFHNVENIKLKEKFPNFKTTMKKGVFECLKNDLLDGSLKFLLLLIQRKKNQFQILD